MDLIELQRNWDQFGKNDPMWAIITKADKKGNKWDKEEFFFTGKKRVSMEIDRLKNWNSNFEFSRALDFGCGIGRLTQGLANYFEQVDGVDIAPSMIDLANEHNQFKEKCNYHLNAANDLNIFDSETFNFVFSLITLQHMKPKYAKRYIREFIRILKPGGYAVFQIPSKPFAINKEKHSLFKKIKLLLKLKPQNYLQKPVMEMYRIPLSAVIQLSQQKGASIQLIRKDNAAGQEWESFTYYIKKN